MKRTYNVCYVNIAWRFFLACLFVWGIGLQLLYFFCLLKNTSAAKCVGYKKHDKKTSVWVVARAVCRGCTDVEKS